MGVIVAWVLARLPAARRLPIAGWVDDAVYVVRLHFIPPHHDNSLRQSPTALGPRVLPAS